LMLLSGIADLDHEIHESRLGPAVSYRACWFRYIFIGVFIFFAGLGQFHMLMIWAVPFSLPAGGVWCLHFVIGTLWTHAVHRWFTFRGTPHHPYLISLVRTYVAYLAGLPLEILLVYVFCDLFTLRV